MANVVRELIHPSPSSLPPPPPKKKKNKENLLCHILFVLFSPPPYRIPTPDNDGCPWTYGTMNSDVVKRKPELHGGLFDAALEYRPGVVKRCPVIDVWEEKGQIHLQPVEVVSHSKEVVRQTITLIH